MGFFLRVSYTQSVRQEGGGGKARCENPMGQQAFVQPFIEVLPLISLFLMQFEIKEMKGKADCERFLQTGQPRGPWKTVL